MPQIDAPTIKRRAAELRSAVAAVRDDWLSALLGQPHAVLAEADGTGHAENFARFALPAGSRRGEVIALVPTALAEGLLQ
jgi:threonylcarbamoyladenosine tRNA methylthiotransferase MtaB